MVSFHVEQAKRNVENGMSVCDALPTLARAVKKFHNLCSAHVLEANKELRRTWGLEANAATEAPEAAEEVDLEWWTCSACTFGNNLGSVCDLCVTPRSQADEAAAVDAKKEFFTCPISLECMVDPVVASDGHTYERVHIEAWLASHDTSPVTGERMEHRTLIPNYCVRSLLRSS